MGFDGFVEVMRYVFLCDIIIPEIREKDKRKNGENTEKTIKTRFSGFRGSYVPFFCVGGGGGQFDCIVNVPQDSQPVTVPSA